MYICRVIAPTFEKLSGQYKQAQFFKCDVDQNQDISRSQGVRAMPTFIIYKGGKAVETVMGADPRKLEAAISKAAGPPSQSTSPSATHSWGQGHTLGSSSEPSRTVPANPLEPVYGALNTVSTAVKEADVGLKVIIGLLSVYFIYVMLS
ncbi:thioredoxin-like protein [Cystobasidium minutum MCA 4210]|uniref:thioredoxin-like protein n=1 Tax=Cystobasidium minutum MCA 4210 TaxID=1397322 RepID=UPI0034CD6388|eukprot:jgi/Rhomi1/101463/CE101462_2786